MAKGKSKISIQDTSQDLLVKPKKQFEDELTERIAFGEEMLARNITTSEEYGKLHKDYTLWHDFNCEFLKRAFDRSNNQYYKDYTSSPAFYSIPLNRPVPSFKEQMGETRGNISKYLNRLKRIVGKIILFDEHPSLHQKVKHSDKLTEGIEFLINLFSKFHRTAQSLRHRHANRNTLLINDEYDLQDLLRGLLQLQFEDVREEDYAPSYAGGNSRVDFVLKDEKIVIETKMTSAHLKDKDIGSQLLIDIGRYRSHPECKLLVVFVYDKGDFIRNKVGLINDLERMSSPELEIKVFIGPK